MWEVIIVATDNRTELLLHPLTPMLGVIFATRNTDTGGGGIFESDTNAGGYY